MVSPIVPILFAILAGILAGAGVFLDFHGLTRPAIVAGLLAQVAFVLMIAVLGDTNWGNMPAYDPETCIDLAWLDGRWTCVPREEAG